jgi:two-component system sensor histidine kinase ChiS
MKNKVLPVSTAIFASLFIFILFWFVDQSERKQHKALNRLKVLHELSIIRAKLESGLNSRLYLVSGLTAYTTLNPDIEIDEFQSLARVLVEGHTGIRSIQLAKDSIVSHIYPLSGNEEAIGLKLLEHPKQRFAAERAISTKKTVVAGPVNLVQGGKAFISRTPIFIPSDADAKVDTAYWGLATILITPEVLFKEAGLQEYTNNIQCAIRGVDGLGAKGLAFLGSKTVFESAPVSLNVSLPNGSWQLAAVPKAGWANAVPASWELRIVGGLTGFLVGLLVYFFVRNRIRLSLEKHKLQTALDDVKKLSGFFPICANCKKIRDDQGYWNQIEEYIHEHSEAEFTHSICPECTNMLYPGILKGESDEEKEN